MPKPAAYLRKSKDAATKAEHLERLLTTVRQHGHNGDTVIYDDWAKSGDIRKLSARTDWLRLVAAIERGEHDVVFMNDLDRGGRSLEEWLRFIRIAQDHGVRVIAGGTDYSLPENKDRLVFEGWLAERELDAAKRRAAETIRMRRKRGDALGGTPYGKKFAKDEAGRVVVVDDPDRPVQPILDAIAEADGHVLTAVRLLNERGVPSRFGKAWSDAALRGTLKRLGKMPPEPSKARRQRSGGLRKPSALAKLVRCHCGQTMTPVDSREGLYCYVGQREGTERHGRYTVSQRPVWELLRREVPRRLRVSVVKADPTKARERRDSLDEELRRLGRAYRAGAVDDAEFDAETERIRSELDQLGDADSDWVDYTRRWTVDFDGDHSELGYALRQRVRAVHLGRDMKPKRIEWREPTA